ncbi:hypothetical protein [Amedibacillus sp. YH-ame10]
MKEKILCYALLLKNDLITFDKYEEYLNNAFLEEPDNSLLLELEFLTSDLCATINLIIGDCYSNENDIDIFGKILLEELKNTYYLKTLSIEEFGKRTYLLWNDIPYSIGKEQPFHTLSYADDPLSWGDINQVRTMYENLFEYYIGRKK